MKKLSFKKLLLAVLSLVMVLTLASCGTKEFQNALAGYLLPEDGTTVEGDFILDSSLTVGEVKYDLTWKSSNEVALSIQENKDDEGNIQSYTAKVDLQNEITDVTLTLGIGKGGKMSKVTKEFHVNVAALTVYSFSSAFSFPKDKATVTEDFDLPQSFTLLGKTATISWSVDERYESYIRISEDGTKCLVTGNDLMPQVLITATFTYNNETTNKSYRMVASRAKTQPENVDDWYYNVGTSIDFNGYVVEIATVYSEQYGNVSFYAVDENNNAGYYVYRGSISKDDAVNLEKGAYVSVTACTSTEYNGLIESTAGCKVTVDASKKDVAKAEAAYALDEDLFAEAPQAIYAQSRMVSLSAWKVKSVDATALGSSSPTTLLTLEKEGKTVIVNVSKYFEGAYAHDAADEVITAILAKVQTLQANDYVNVTGVLGNYKGAEQIALLSAAGLEKTTAEAEGTAHPGLTVKPLIAANIATLEEAKIQKGSKTLIVASDKVVTLAASTEDVTITYELMGASNNVALEANVLTITPSDEEKVTVKITYTCGEYVSVDFFAVRSVSKTDQEKVDDEIEAFDDAEWTGEYTANTTLSTLPAKGATFEDVTFAYTVEDADEAQLVEIADGKIYLLPVDENTNVTVKATATLNEATASTTFTITITPESFTKYAAVTAPEADKEYYLGLYQATVGKWMFINGELSGNYGASVEDYTQAKKVKLVITDEATMSAKIQVLMGNDVVKYLNVAVSGTYNNLAYGDDAETATVWTWNVDHGTGLATGADGNKVYLGTYSSFTTFSFSKESYLASCDIEGATSFCVKLYTVEADDSTREERAQKSLDALKLQATVEENYTLPTEAAYDDVKLSYALKEVVEGQSIENGVLKITRGNTDITLTIVATATCGLGVSKTKEFTVKVVANATKVSFNEAYEIVSAYEGSHTSDLTYEVTAYVSKLDTGSYTNAWISDGSGREIQLYGITDRKVGDIITVVGKLCKFVESNGTVVLEMTGCKVKEVIKAQATIATPTQIDAAFRAEGANMTELEALTYITSGVVDKIEDAYSTQYKNITIWIADSTNHVEAFRLKGEDAENIAVGDFIAVYGNVTLYGTVVEFKSGCEILAMTHIAHDKISELKANDSNKVVAGYLEKIGETGYYVLSDGTGIVGLTFADELQFVLKPGYLYEVKLDDLHLETINTLELGFLCTEVEEAPGFVYSEGKIAAAKKAQDELLAVGKYLVEGVEITSNAAKAGSVVSLTLLTESFMPFEIADGTYDLTGYAIKVIKTSEEDNTYNVVFVVMNATPQQGKTLDTAYTVAKAHELAEDLERISSATLDNTLAGYFAGVVTTAGTYNGSYTSNMRISDADAEEGAKDLLVYSVNDGATDNLKNPLLNDQVVIKGFLANYNGTIEITRAKDASNNNVNCTIERIVRGTSTIAVSAASSEFAHVELSAQSGVNLTTFTFTVTVDDGYELVSVKVNGVAVEAVEGTYTGTIAGPTSVTVETKEAGAAEPLKATMAYSAGTTTNMTTGNNAATVGLDASLFTVTAIKGSGSNLPGLNKANDIRIYKDGNGFTVSIASGYNIGKVTISLKSGSGQTVYAADGTTEIQGTDNVYLVNGSAFTVLNKTSGTIQINSIVIEYTEVE